MDRVFIRNLTTETIIGIYDFERVQKQPIIVTLDMAWDNRKPANTEDITDALDYEKISNSVKSLIENSSYQLVETLTEAIAKHVITTYGTAELTIELQKPDAIAFAEAVGIKITRRLTDYI